MAVRVVVAADATAVTQTIDQIREAIKRAGQEGKQFADLDLSHPELAGTADDIRKVQANLENLLKARGSTARDARSIFGSGDILDFLEARERIGRKFGTPDEAPANTALTGAVLQALSGAATFPSAGSVLFPFGCSTSQANGVAISEFGLLTAGGVLFARKTRPAPIYKTSAISFQGTWTITLEAP